MRYRERTALLNLAYEAICKNICLPTGIRRPPGSCWKSTPHESEPSETADGRPDPCGEAHGFTHPEQAFWWLGAGTATAGAAQENQSNQTSVISVKTKILWYKLFSNTIIIWPTYYQMYTITHGPRLNYRAGWAGNFDVLIEWLLGPEWADRGNLMVMWPCHVTLFTRPNSQPIPKSLTNSPQLGRKLRSN